MLQRTTPLLTESIARGSVPNPIQTDTPLSSKLAATMQSRRNQRLRPGGSKSAFDGAPAHTNERPTFNLAALHRHGSCGPRPLPPEGQMPAVLLLGGAAVAPRDVHIPSASTAPRVKIRYREMGVPENDRHGKDETRARTATGEERARTVGKALGFWPFTPITDCTDYQRRTLAPDPGGRARPRPLN
jgi:hypothetical protein